MAVCSFLETMRIPYRPIFFNHGTLTSAEAETFLRERFGDGLIVGHITGRQKKGQSLEEFWRNERNKFFKSRNSIIVTAHHLDDAVETYVWSALHGQPKIPLYHNGLVYRPFMLNRKSEFVSWCKRHKVKWIEDKSNKNTDFTRNFIRRKLMPGVLKVNPGIHKVVAKKVQAAFKEQPW